MKFAAQPVNVEGNGGASLRVALTLTDAPPGATIALWAARLPDALTMDRLRTLASGAFSLSAQGFVRQDGGLHGLRQAQSQSVNYGPGGTTLALEGSLYAPGADMPPRYLGAPSWDVSVYPLLERSDGPWLLAVTATAPDGTVTVAHGGLGQQAGQEHLAGVWLAPSQLAPEIEVGLWLESTVRSLKPVLDSRMANVSQGQDLTLKDVLFTGEVSPDAWPSLLIVPEAETDTPDGLAAPDRAEVRLSYIIRGVSYGDQPEWKVRALTQLLGTLKETLNTRKLRQACLPSGRGLYLARATSLTFGRTEDSWDEAAELSWSCTLINTGIF